MRFYSMVDATQKTVASARSTRRYESTRPGRGWKRRRSDSPENPQGADGPRERPGERYFLTARHLGAFVNPRASAVSVASPHGRGSQTPRTSRLVAGTRSLTRERSKRAKGFEPSTFSLEGWLGQHSSCPGRRYGGLAASGRASAVRRHSTPLRVCHRLPQALHGTCRGT